MLGWVREYIKVYDITFVTVYRRIGHMKAGLAWISLKFPHTGSIEALIRSTISQVQWNVNSLFHDGFVEYLYWVHKSFWERTIWVLFSTDIPVLLYLYF